MEQEIWSAQGKISARDCGQGAVRSSFIYMCTYALHTRICPCHSLCLPTLQVPGTHNLPGSNCGTMLDKLRCTVADTESASRSRRRRLNWPGWRQLTWESQFKKLNGTWSEFLSFLLCMSTCISASIDELLIMHSTLLASHE